jgi:S1-C subfamily serine protease
MRRYLAFVPDAADAAQMQARIDEWARLAPPPAEDPTPPMPAGMRVGFATTDTPAIVAMWKAQPDLEGALVTYIFADSMAAKGGLAKGDIVLSFNGAAIHGAQDFLSASWKVTAGATVNIEVLRGTQKIPLKLQY